MAIMKYQLFKKYVFLFGAGNHLFMISMKLSDLSMILNHLEKLKMKLWMR